MAASEGKTRAYRNNDFRFYSLIFWSAVVILIFFLLVDHFIVVESIMKLHVSLQDNAGGNS